MVNCTPSCCLTPFPFVNRPDAKNGRNETMPGRKRRGRRKGWLSLALGTIVSRPLAPPPDSFPWRKRGNEKKSAQGTAGLGFGEDRFSTPRTPPRPPPAATGPGNHPSAIAGPPAAKGNVIASAFLNGPCPLPRRYAVTRIGRRHGCGPALPAGPNK
jgi:hypothetical protein